MKHLANMQIKSRDWPHQSSIDVIKLSGGLVSCRKGKPPCPSAVVPQAMSQDLHDYLREKQIAVTVIVLEANIVA